MRLSCAVLVVHPDNTVQGRRPGAGIHMNIYIGLFLAFGGCFGLATFSHRHLFSEGPHAPQAEGKRRAGGALAFWVCLCALLWPIMALSGANTAWVLARRKVRARIDSDSR